MKTLIINCPALNTGGVENISFSLMRYSIKQGYRVIWLHKVPVIIADGFKEFVFKNVEMIPARRTVTGKWKHGNMEFAANEQVTVLSFTPFDMDNSIKLCQEFPDVTINPIYMVANTKGRYYYIEEYYYGPLRRMLFKPVQKLMENWTEADVVRFCAELQITSFECHYNLCIDNHKEKLLKGIDKMPELDMSLLKKRARREKMNIVSISRFDFPHKNYLLGLIRTYGRMKKQYPNLYLHIIGYGQGESEVKRTIEMLPMEAQKDIVLYGEIAKDDLPEFLRNMHLNISVAGSVGVGAKNGVLSIPARNFCGDDCEVYGLLPEAKKMTTSTEKGEDVAPFIERVIGMSDDEYIKRCVDSYKLYADNEIDPEYVFKQRANPQKEYLDRHRMIDYMYAFRDISYKVGSLLHLK